MRFRQFRLYITVGEAPLTTIEHQHQSTEKSSLETSISSIIITNIIILTQTYIMSKLINRVTLFKLDGAENQAKLLAAYEKLAKEQNRVSRVVDEAQVCNSL